MIGIEGFRTWINYIRLIAEMLKFFSAFYIVMKRDCMLYMPLFHKLSKSNNWCESWSVCLQRTLLTISFKKLIIFYKFPYFWLLYNRSHNFIVTQNRLILLESCFKRYCINHWPINVRVIHWYIFATLAFELTLRGCHKNTVLNIYIFII